jgi:hypothetical protein
MDDEVHPLALDALMRVKTAPIAGRFRERLASCLLFDRDQGPPWRWEISFGRIRRIAMRYIKVDEALWASSMLPEGILERWFIDSGDAIEAGERIAEIRIEDALHEIVAPATGRATIVATANAVIEPGSILATLELQSP